MDQQEPQPKPDLQVASSTESSKRYASSWRKRILTGVLGGEAALGAYGVYEGIAQGKPMLAIASGLTAGLAGVVTWAREKYMKPIVPRLKTPPDLEVA